MTFRLNYSGATEPFLVQTIASPYGTATEPATDPTRSGYVFGGWYTEAECTNEVDFDTVLSAGATYYAKWTAE